MSILRHARSAVAIAALISLCPTPALAKNRQENGTLRLRVQFAEPAACKIDLEGKSFSLPDDEDALLAALKSRYAKGRRISVGGGADIPYRCLGHAIYLAQPAGFEKVGFVAEPDDPE